MCHGVHSAGLAQLRSWLAILLVISLSLFCSGARIASHKRLTGHEASYNNGTCDALPCNTEGQEGKCAVDGGSVMSLVLRYSGSQMFSSVAGGQSSGNPIIREEGKYTLKKGGLKSLSKTVCYRTEMDLKAKEKGNKLERHIRWGRTVTGIDQGNGWLKISGKKTRYLPMAIRGHLVLKPKGVKSHLETERQKLL